MGQTSSRHQQRSNEDVPSSPSSQSVVASSSAAQSESPSDTTPESSNPPRSRRSSLRKNIINLVKPSGSRNRTTSQSSNAGDYSRSWRNSRRWSKAPPDSTCPVIVEPPSTSSSDSSLPGPSDVHAIPLDKGKQREILSSTEEDEQDSDNKVLSVSHSTLLSSVPGPPDVDSDKASSNAESSHTAPDALYGDLHPDDDGILPQWPELEPGYYPDLDHLDLPVPAPVSGESGLLNSVAPVQEQSPTQPGPRPFPPPGTLVVVQGIVHTTDVANSRPGNASGTTSLPIDSTLPPASPILPTADNSTESGTGRVRNRLSTLLRSRSIARGSNSGQVSASNSLSRLATPEPNISAAASPAASTAPSRAHSTAPTADESHRTTQEPPSNTNQQLPTGDTPSSISSSSIDVLGTLLSVAAAATAASLLTGSSEPILSSGLAPTGTNSSPHIPHASPTTPSIPNLPPYSGVLPAESGMPDISAAGRAERMREAWGAIRQRLGLRPSSGAPAPEGNNTFASQSPNPESVPTVSGLGSLTDTRELMLAEMARAFNIGLGLNGLGGLTPNTIPAAPPPLTPSSSVSLLASDDEHDNLLRPVTQAPPVAAVPPEGSFERFLVDLQVDLRLALTQGPRPPAAQQPAPPAESPAAPVIANVTSRIPIITENRPRTDGHPTRVDTPRPNDDEDHDSMPDPQDVSDSDSEIDEDEDEDEEEFQSADHSSAPEPEHSEPTPHVRFPVSGTSHMDASGRINWWRLYRFPAIPPPRADLAGLRPAAAGASIPPVRPVTTSPVHNEGSVAPADPLVPEQISEAPQPQVVPAPAPPPTVVPVIVVGLQSVDTDWRHEDVDSLNDETDLFGAPNADVQANGTDGAASDGVDGLGQRRPDSGGVEPVNNTTGHDGSRTGRTRGWHTRAANALRNLRPGRRTADASTGAPTATFLPGSRTFLIYVIGGYYPPDHSIVTGGPNVLDSFEALLELADLLGQVKPPTATKTDLEKSGLEIIKASEVPQHEKDGKISSNCTDRCLICLDDYEPEDQVRVMSCRHAFHKGCVDEWLLKGRNNCPACRSTGVNTESHSSSHQVPEAH